MVQKDTGGRYYLRSNNGKLLNIPPRKSLSMLGDRSFYMACMMKNASKASKVEVVIGSALSKGWRFGPEAFRVGHFLTLL